MDPLDARFGDATASVVNLLRTQAKRTPDAPCLAFEDEAIGFGELDARSSLLANALSREGVRAGDRVAILSGQAPVFFELLYACAKLGAIMAPLNWRLSAREVAAILADAAPRLILVAPEHASLLAAETGDARRIDLVSDYTAWRDAASDTDPNAAISPATPLLLLYTSGTTGQPKGVMIGHGALALVERMAREVWGFTARSVNLVAMPLFHIGGIGYGLMATTQGGLTVIARQTDPAALLALARRHGVTHGFFVPTVIERLLDAVDRGEPAPTSLERILYGASPISEALVRRALKAFGCRFNHAYGMTETSGTVITLAPEDHDPDGPRAGRLRSCGRAVPWAEIALVDPLTGAPTPVGEIGEIRVRSPMTMLGYWSRPEETRAALTTDGWLRTGDAASRDADGYIYIQDRYKDMIVSGGENIYPTEIENVLAEHPDVAEVSVIGAPHPRWVETPRAYVVRSTGAAATEAVLIAFARERLAHYKCPTSVVFVDALPRTASGKVLKPELRRLDRERHGAGADRLEPVR